MNSDFKVEKLVVKDVIKETINLYKDNFSLFFKINAIGILIMLLTGNVRLLKMFSNTSYINTVIDMVGLVIMFVGIYYNTRLSVSLILAIKDRYNNKVISIKEAYVRAKDYTWNYIGAALLLGLIAVIPIIIIFIGYYVVESITFKIITILVGIIPLSYLTVKYGLGPYVRIFKPTIQQYFSYGKKLVENYFWKVLIISLIPFIATIPNHLFKFLIDETNLGIINGFIYANFGLLINLFLAPLTIGMIVITYLKLDR